MQRFAQTAGGEFRAELQSSEFWDLLFDGLETSQKTPCNLTEAPL